MGIALHDGAVHECAGVTLVAVADDVFLVALLLSGAVPFLSGGETAAASAAQTGIDDGLADLSVGHVEQSLFEGSVAVSGDVFFDALRIVSAAVLQHHSVLLFIERNVFLSGIGHAVHVIDQAVDDLALQNGLLDDLVNVFGLYVAIQDACRLDVQQRSHLAEAVAAAHLQVQGLLLIRIVL